MQLGACVRACRFSEGRYAHTRECLELASPTKDYGTGTQIFACPHSVTHGQCIDTKQQLVVERLSMSFAMTN